MGESLLRLSTSATPGRWVIYVCEKCRTPHAGGRSASCIVELDPAGDTLADTERVPVVPCDDAAIERAARAIRKGWGMGDDETGVRASVALAVAALRAAGGAE